MQNDGIAWQHLIRALNFVQHLLHLISMQVQNPVRKDIAKLKEDIANFKQEMMVCNIV